MSGIDYSKWNKLDYDDSSSEDEKDNVTKKSSEASSRIKNPFAVDRSAIPSTSNPKRTRVRRTYEYNFDNMTPADWEELQLSADRLAYLNEAYGAGGSTTGLFPSQFEINMDACRRLRDDIQEHKDFWLEEIFHPVEADMDPSNVERAVIALSALCSYYFRKTKCEKGLAVANLLTDVMECYRVLVFENPLFKIDQEQKKRYRVREYDYHLQRYNVASLLDEKDMAVESFRRCTELELAGIESSEGKTFVEMLSPETAAAATLLEEASSYSSMTELFEAKGVKAMEKIVALQNVPPLTIAKLQNEITDDEIWSIISRAAAVSRKVTSGGFDMATTTCPVCALGENLRCCSCGKVAYCSPEHQYIHWQQHKRHCACPVCGTKENLRLCSGCHQIAFCCQEHIEAYWSKHKNDCKQGKKGKHIGEAVSSSPDDLEKLMKQLYH